MQDQDIQEFLDQISKELGIDLRSPIEYVEDIFKLEKNVLLKFAEEDSDWAFIIKTHAFLEAAVTQFLTEYFHEDNLKDAFTYLELGNTRTGKIVFLKAVGVLEADEEHLLKQFSKLTLIQ